MSGEKKMSHRFTISLSEESFNIVERYRNVLGVSRAKLIDSWILEAKDMHEEVLEKLEAVLNEVGEIRERK